VDLTSLRAHISQLSAGSPRDDCIAVLDGPVDTSHDLLRRCRPSGDRQFAAQHRRIRRDVVARHAHCQPDLEPDELLATQLVASVVPVPDAETAPLMVAFHQRLAAGAPPASALAAAQNELGGSTDDRTFAASAVSCVWDPGFSRCGRSRRDRRHRQIGDVLRPVHPARRYPCRVRISRTGSASASG